MKTNPNDICHQNISQDMGGNFHHGLTKREYFAALALQRMMAADQFCLTTNHDLNLAIELSVKSADRLIEELNKETK